MWTGTDHFPMNLSASVLICLRCRGGRRCGCASCLGCLGRFLGAALSFIAFILLWTNALVIFRGLEQFFHVVDTASIGGELEVVIHDDRVEGTVLGAEATVHADVYVDIELGRLGDRAAGSRVVRAHDPDTLRRADLGTNTARGAALFP